MKNFTIHEHEGVVSDKFCRISIRDFHSACKYIAGLPYKRNFDKNNILCIFNDFGGTCSTKHAALRKLAFENNQQDVKLFLGIFKMDSEYTQEIHNTLEKFGLRYIPEAHNYLKIDDEYFDFTKPNSNYDQFKNKLLIEKEIEFNEIAGEKKSFHIDFLKKWLAIESIPYTLVEIWDIREQCIRDLQKNDEDEIQNFSSVCFVNSLEVRDDYKV